MYRTLFNAKRLFLIGGDIVLLQAALAVTLWVRYGSITPNHWHLHRTPFLVISLLWVIGLFVTGLYDLSRAQNSLVFFRTFLEGMFVNLLVAFAFFYLIPLFDIAPRTNLLLFFAISLLFIYTWRLLFNRITTQTSFQNRLLYIGPAQDALVLQELLRNNGFGFVLVAVIHTTPRTSHETNGLRWEERVSNLSAILEQERISGIVLGQSIDAIPELREELYKTLFSSMLIIDRKELEEMVSGRIPIASVDKAWFLEHLREADKTWYEAVKRGYDIFLSVPVGIVTLILFPFIAVGTKLSSPGPVLFRQERVGRRGKRFRILKFRTMRVDAEAEGPQFATHKDPRATSFGRFLRIMRLDELPQIWNVLVGDMSFVGPRPERPEFVAHLVERMPYYALRHLSRPGLTGWAQVKYKYTSSLDDSLVKLQYDLYYVKHRSLLLDAAILLKTINTVIRRQGT
jgi:exopolysaccharide biosynthesis polyprenyl glycosylphosphotransferase